MLVKAIIQPLQIQLLEYLVLVRLSWLLHTPHALESNPYLSDSRRSERDIFIRPHFFLCFGALYVFEHTLLLLCEITWNFFYNKRLHFLLHTYYFPLFQIVAHFSKTKYHVVFLQKFSIWLNIACRTPKS